MGEPTRKTIDLKLDTLISSIRQSKPPAKPKVAGVKKLESESHYQNRFRAQKELLIHQKQIILRQEQTIKQLQFEKLSLECEISSLKESLDPSDLAVHKEESKKLKEKIEMTKWIPPRPQEPPEVIRRMYQREEERRQRRKYFEEQKNLKILQKKEAQEQAERENRIKAAEIRKMKQKEEKEKKRHEKEEKERRKELKKIGKKLGDRLLFNECFRKWLMCTRMFKSKIESCLTIYRNMEIKNSLRKWNMMVAMARKERIENAASRINVFFLRILLGKWREAVEERKERVCAAVNIYHQELARSYFRNWHLYCLKSQIHREQVFPEFETIYFRIMNKEYLFRWKNYCRRRREKSEKEKRMKLWQESVRKLLPDFQGLEE